MRCADRGSGLPQFERSGYLKALVAKVTGPPEVWLTNIVYARTLVADFTNLFWCLHGGVERPTRWW
jgi:hypothetical protein